MLFYFRLKFQIIHHKSFEFHQNLRQMSILYFFIFALCLWLLWRLFRQYITFTGEPPLCAGYPLIGHAIEFGSDYVGVLRRAVKMHPNSKVVTLYIAGERMHFVYDQRDHSSILRKPKSLAFRPISDQVFKNAFGLAQDTNTDIFNDWHAQSPTQWAMIRGKSLIRLKRTMRKEILSSVLEAESDFKCKSGKSNPWIEISDFYSLISEVIWRSTARSLFGDALGIDKKTLKKSQAAFNAFDSVFPFLVGGFPIKFFSEASKGLKHIQKCFTEMNGILKGSVSPLLAFRQKWLHKNFSFSPGDKESAQSAMVWASQANTIPAGFWSLFHTFTITDKNLSTACHHEAKVAYDYIKRQVTEDEEIPQVPSNQPEQFDTDPTSEASCPYIHACVSEALRLCTASLLIRRVEKNMELQLKGSQDRFNVRKGDKVVVAPALVHMDNKYFVNSDLFQPQRFLAAEHKDKINGQSIDCDHHNINTNILKQYLKTFGGGVSMCPGRFLALSSVRTLLSIILARWEIQFGPCDRTTSEYEHTAKPAVPVPVVDMSRAGLGILPPKGKVPCRIRIRT